MVDRELLVTNGRHERGSYGELIDFERRVLVNIDLIEVVSTMGCFRRKYRLSNRTLLYSFRCDIVSALLPRLADSIDILLFNPPYVPTDQEEVDVSDLVGYGSY